MCAAELRAATRELFKRRAGDGHWWKMVSKGPEKAFHEGVLRAPDVPVGFLPKKMAEYLERFATKVIARFRASA